MGATVKKCRKGEHMVSIKEFYKGDYWCKGCRAEYNRERRAKLKTEGKIEVSMKMCNECKKVQPIEEFHVDNAQLDGRKSSCKLCSKKRRVEKESDPEYRENRLEKQRVWRENNPSKVAEYVRRQCVKAKYKRKGVKVFK